MSDTPRTDAETFEYNGVDLVNAAISIELERELAAAKSRIAELETQDTNWQTEIKALQSWIKNLKRDCDSLTSSNAALTKELSDASNISPDERDDIKTHIQMMTTIEQRKMMGLDERPLHLQVLRILSALSTALSTIEKLKGFVMHKSNCNKVYYREHDCTCGLLNPTDERTKS